MSMKLKFGSNSLRQSAVPEAKEVGDTNSNGNSKQDGTPQPEEADSPIFQSERKIQAFQTPSGKSAAKVEQEENRPKVARSKTRRDAVRDVLMSNEVQVGECKWA